MKKILKSIVKGLTALSLIGLPVVSAQEETVNIGILQYIEHESLDATREGFIDQLDELGYTDGEKIKINEYNAAGDNSNMQSMSESLTDSNDYLFAISTPAAQTLANVEMEKPIYFSAVTDAVEAGLVESNEKPGRNVTGTIDAGPVKEQAELVKAIYPDAKKVGLIYNSGEANSVVEAERAKAALEDLGLEVVEQTVTSTNDISQNLSALINDGVDVVFTVTDNTIASAMKLAGDLCKEAGIGLIGGSTDMVETNGLATYGLDYYELGRQTARMLVRQIEEDLTPDQMPVEEAEELSLVVNSEYAESVGINPEDIKLPTAE